MNCCGNTLSGARLLAALAGLLFFALLVKVTWDMVKPPPLAAERAAERAKARAELTAQEAEQLTTYGWVDKNKGVVRLPLEAARTLALREMQHPLQARSNLLARVAKAFPPPPPPPPEKPSAYE
jgi:hypothetical protein